MCCVHMCTSSCTCTYVQVHACAHGGQRLKLNVIVLYLSPPRFWNKVSLDPELPDLARLAGLWAPEILLGARVTSVHLDFHTDVKYPNSCSSDCTKIFLFQRQGLTLSPWLTWNSLWKSSTLECRDPSASACCMLDWRCEPPCPAQTALRTWVASMALLAYLKR